MKFNGPSLMVLVSIILILLIGLSGCLSTEPDSAGSKDEAKYSLVAPNGLSFGLIRGYENWEIIATHYRTDKNELRYILGNTKLIESYKAGAGRDGKKFQDGSILVKIGYSLKPNPAWDASIEPDVLQRVEYQVKDSNKFKDTEGWMWARFVYDPETDSYSNFGEDENFAIECLGCHAKVEKKDYVFTDYVWKG
jgi:hypothetical protein